MPDSPKKSILPYLLPLILFIGLTGVFLVMMLRGADKESLPSALIGQKIPQFTAPILQRPNQETVKLTLKSDDLIGQVSLVNIWGSWCAPCRLEHPFLMALAKQKKWKIIGFNYKDTQENANQFLDQLGDPYDLIIYDEMGRLSIDWGVYGVPETYILDAKGIIRYRHIGPINESNLNTVILPQLEQADSQTKF